MKKIGYGQLFAVLLLIKIFGFVCSKSAYSTEQMTGVFISTIAQAIIVIPMLVLCNSNKINLKKDVPFGKFGLAIYVIFFLLWGAFSFVRLWDVTGSISLPVKNKVFAGFLIALICLYASRLGLKVLARSAVIVLGLLALALAVMLIGAYSKIEILNLVKNENSKSIWNYALNDFCESGELVALLVLLNFTRSHHKKAVYSFLTAKLVIIEFVSFIGISVTGHLMQVIEFPFFEIGAYTQPFSTQRADSIYTVLFTFLCVINITVQIILASVLIEEIFPKYKFNELTSIILMLIISVAINSTDMDFSLIWGGLIILLSVVAPLIMYTRRKINAEVQKS